MPCPSTPPLSHCAPSPEEGRTEEFWNEAGWVVSSSSSGLPLSLSENPTQLSHYWGLGCGSGVGAHPSAAGSHPCPPNCGALGLELL